MYGVFIKLWYFHFTFLITMSLKMEFLQIFSPAKVFTLYSKTFFTSIKTPYQNFTDSLNRMTRFGDFSSKKDESSDRCALYGEHLADVERG